MKVVGVGMNSKQRIEVKIEYKRNLEKLEGIMQKYLVELKNMRSTYVNTISLLK